MKRIAFALVATLLATNLAAEPAWTPSNGEELRFTLLDKKDRDIGSLVFRFESTEDGLRVTRTEAMQTKKLFIKVKVDQTTSSLWREGKLISVVSDTAAETSLKDKTVHLEVTPTEDGGLRASVNGETHELPATAWPMTLWHVGFMDRGQLFGTGGGELINLTVRPADTETLETPAGPRQCRRFDVAAELEGKRLDNTLWYRADGRLCAMLMNTGLGPVRYLPVD